jgi:hypothetical protein
VPIPIEHPHQLVPQSIDYQWRWHGSDGTERGFLTGAGVPVWGVTMQNVGQPPVSP